ncbi:hypothetical protein UN64_08745 [Fictibacillus arsenicus]|uniref:Uncharacterized protein n=1 Tax=Fictibacillus arsenicus TaxID=255247 RepID=A0A1V3G6X8_9BACL|nr:hypothetical protein UN64_08745 [Fictibacillus arsenicus]
MRKPHKWCKELIVGLKSFFVGSYPLFVGKINLTWDKTDLPWDYFLMIIPRGQFVLNVFHRNANIKKAVTQKRNLLSLPAFFINL